MKLTFEQIKSASGGAVRIENRKEGISFYRFTMAQETLYKNTNADFYQKTFSTAGIRLTFKTNSETLSLKAVTLPSSSRTYFSFDILVNGAFLDCLDNFTNVELPEIYPEATLNLGDFSKDFYLGQGEKTVSIHFPWSVEAILKEIVLDDAATFVPKKPDKKMLIFGDSITHGYDAKHPSRRYAGRIAEALGAEEVNKAIGGELFFPALAELKDEFSPEYVMIAYGTNDWGKGSAEVFKQNSAKFIGAISRNYPDAKIYVLTPIWRKDILKKTQFESFHDVEKHLLVAAEPLQNVTVIRGFDFVPKEEKYFSDKYLHPNDEGFDFYFNSLLAQLLQL